MKELAKTYSPKDIEEKIYKRWEESGYFNADVDRSKKPFTIVMPPPNITGQLHMGHALDNTMQDILTRFKRMQGFNALWQPGTDHASIATEVKVIEHLKAQGIDKDEIGREKFLEYCWDWKKEYGGRIVSQLKKMGSSADWRRERFTMDEGCSAAVEDAFVKLFDDGYIYKGNRIINWCPVCQTSISDAEVEHEEQAGHFWHMKYEIVGEPGRFVEFATTRPETMLGDTAVAVNPNDDRYKDIIGKTVLLPFMDREIPVVADEYVDMEFGTGVVKITPGHDPNDFEVGKRHDLEVITILNDDATMTADCKEFAGMDRYEARELIVKRMDEMGQLIKIEPHIHNVGTHDRCGTTIEPMVKPQWFVAMEDLAKPAIEAISNGDLTFVPKNYDKTYLHWLENIRDWCISRQLWWGHRIPAYYCDDCGNTVVAKSKDAPSACPKCGGSMHQDEDTLDTWFSSALWPFSTVGWPDESEDYKYFYPTDILVTGYDIIFFWVIRMVFSGYAHTGKSPFHTVLIHGLVRDSEGRKMSKSLGNGIDPLDVIDKYGADALRLTLITGNAPGNDMRFYWDRVEASRNFANKVYNASRFILMNLDGVDVMKPADEDLCIEDKWIKSKLNTVIKEVTDNLEKFELGIAVSKVYDFIWDEFCDWYIEFVKPRIYEKDTDAVSANAALYTLRTVLADALKLLHPYMPFITEEIYLALIPEEETIMTSSWPLYDESVADAYSEGVIDRAKEIVRGMRTLRKDMDVAPSRKAKLMIVCGSDSAKAEIEDASIVFKGLAGATDVELLADESSLEGSEVVVVVRDAKIFVPLADLVDFEKEIARLSKEKEKLSKEIARSKGMLSNEKFVSKAPEAKVAEERAKLENYEQMFKDVSDRLNQMQNA